MPFDAEAFARSGLRLLRPGQRLTVELSSRDGALRVTALRIPRRLAVGLASLHVREPDPLFADPRLAVLYDVLDDDRSDLELYEAVVREVGASTVVDIGCGHQDPWPCGWRLRGARVVGVDPARSVPRRGPVEAMRRPGGGGRTVTPPRSTARPIEADLAVMTGNVAQVFVDDVDWAQTLAAVHGCRPAEGWFVFETRRPEVRDWEHWDIAPRSVELPSGESIVFSLTVTAVEPPLVTFESTTVIPG